MYLPIARQFPPSNAYQHDYMDSFIRRILNISYMYVCMHASAFIRC